MSRAVPALRKPSGLGMSRAGLERRGDANYGGSACSSRRREPAAREAAQPANPFGADPTARFLFDFGEDDSNLNPFHLHEGLKTLEIAFQTEPLDEA